MARPRGRTVVIGFELGDAHLVHAWARAGRLPALQKLLDRGSWRWLETTADQLHISAWPCIYTGAPPGEHGVYFTFQPAPGVQGYRRFHDGLYGRPTFWNMLDRAGRKCAVFDAPYTHPEADCRSAFVHDWGCWARYLKTGSVPPALQARLEKDCGGYPLGMEANDLGLAPLDAADTSRRLVTAVQAKSRAANWLLRQQPGELQFTVFGETHVAGHYCWSPALRDAGAMLRPSPMLAVYEELDRAVDSMVREAGDDATVVVISGDSVVPNHAGWHLLPEVLQRLGYLAGPVRAPAAGGAGDGGQTRRFDPVRAVRDLLPKDFRKNLARMLPTALRDRLAQRVDSANVDWSRTRAYCLPTDLEGYIRINLRGREPQGTVEPGPQFEQALAELTDEFAQLRDPATGRAIVRDVLRTDRAFPGARSDWLPDLVVRWQPEAPISAAASARVGVVSLASPDPRPGTHAGPGFVLAAGPGIPAGGSLTAGHILDFAPTLLARQGVEVPAHMRGQVWPEWIDSLADVRRSAS
jgi:predicted AlkP superfamily phosphohydrolase/phosphomutase